MMMMMMMMMMMYVLRNLHTESPVLRKTPS